MRVRSDCEPCLTTLRKYFLHSWTLLSKKQGRTMHKRLLPQWHCNVLHELPSVSEMWFSYFAPCGPDNTGRESLDGPVCLFLWLHAFSSRPVCNKSMFPQTRPEIKVFKAQFLFFCTCISAKVNPDECLCLSLMYRALQPNLLHRSFELFFCWLFKGSRASCKHDNTDTLFKILIITIVNLCWFLSPLGESQSSISLRMSCFT